MSDSEFDIPDHWSFRDDDVAASFETHVREQLPWYDLATESVRCVVRHYAPESGRVYDLGASTGNVGRSLAATIEHRDVDFIGVERSEEMAERYEAPGELIIEDAVEVDYKPHDVCVVFLALMFLSRARRQRLLDKIAEALRPGGAIVVFDKRESHAGYPGTIMHRLTLDQKRQSGVSSERIIDKELSLSGVQRPVSDDELPGDPIEFFKFGEFSGWIIEQETL